MRQGQKKQRRRYKAGLSSSLFGEEGVDSVLHAMDKLPLMRRLSVLQVVGAGRLLDPQGIIVEVIS